MASFSGQQFVTELSQSWCCVGLLIEFLISSFRLFISEYGVQMAGSVSRSSIYLGV